MSAAAAGTGDNGVLYLDPAQSVDVRTSDLLARMTLPEKIAQLGYGAGASNATAQCARARGLGLGGVSCGAPTARDCPGWTNTLQACLANTTRLGIPASIYAETTHSGGTVGSTIFPSPVGLGATWNATLVREIASAIALELRATGGDQALSPVLQVVTDPRFGRGEENFGEDPHLVATMGAASVRGLQGEDGLGGAGTYLGRACTHSAFFLLKLLVHGQGPLGSGAH